MSGNDLRDEVEVRPAPRQQQLGADRADHTTHVLRVLALCDLPAARRMRTNPASPLTVVKW
ncbi:hypothetical protein [Nocardia sp. bgisy134]|uniref:hypothetical protein n=1 Tax=unclassified Nocardia TaxID=2637762 RepID=UPI003D72C71A